MKLELKHLAPYLPYRLKMRCIEDKTNHILTIAHQTYDLSTVGLYPILKGDFYKKFKPILRPLSDLTKEIGFNGEVVVVADIIFPEEDYTNKFDRNVAIGALQLQNAIGHTCTFYQVVETLFKYHFDVFNLIDKGLAIDIKSLNP